ncbi:MAG: GTPase HflX [Chloroflexi bacterium]|nr:GTPase HflX [Chloroflexota bacterium]
MAVDSPGSRHWSAKASLDELEMLSRTAGARPVLRIQQRLKQPDRKSYIGKGKLQELIEARADLHYNVAIFDDELSPAQQRTLEQRLGVKVIDRTALILDIFAQRARTREGKLQVALAQHEYLLPRLRGQWSHLERMEGAIGLRGPGETQLETDRRLIRNQIKSLKKQIEQVREQRRVYRDRRRKAGVPIVALVGYTNAGKSTLMNQMTHAQLGARDRLFETLDPVTRRLHLSDDLTVLLTDTVGFIQKLPTGLVAAFRATLEELGDADLLLHVVDLTHPDAAEQAQTVEDTLDQLGVGESPRLTVFNKADDFEIEGLGLPRSLDDLEPVVRDLELQRPDAVLVSALEGWGLDELRRRIADVIEGREPAPREAAPEEPVEAPASTAAASGAG